MHCAVGSTFEYGKASSIVQDTIHQTIEQLKRTVMAERKTTSSNYLNQSFLEEKCPLNELIYLLSKRWITEVLFSIEEGNNRFSSIKEDLIHISDHILADRLKLLENNGFIRKMVTPERVDYKLTETGSELSDMLEKLCHFAETTDLAKG